MTDIIDVSKYQGTIDWSKVPYDTAIIRVGYRKGTTGTIEADVCADRNLNQARAFGKKVGVYFFTQAVTIDEAREEADFACDHAGKLDLPVFIDTENTPKKNGRADHMIKSARTVIVMAFCTRVMERGYKAGVYASQSWFQTCLEYSKLQHYTIWVARYSDKEPSYPPKYDFWQYTSNGESNGVTGRVDLSKRYVKATTTTTTTAKKDILIAQASYGETGIRGQIAGNQNGKEMNIKPYYEHAKGWRVFRAPTIKKQHDICYAALRGAKNPCIGYDQGDRNTLFVASQKYGYDPGAVTIDVECDCSSFVRVCCAYARIMLPDFTTASEPAVLLHAGFTEVTTDDLQIGDILCTKTKGHTCIVVQA